MTTPFATHDVFNQSPPFQDINLFTSDKALNFFLERYDAAYRNELDAFIGAVKAGSKPYPDGEDGLKALLLADAAYRSWKTGQRVAVG